MNPRQRKVLKGALAAVILTLAFPPFVLVGGVITEGIGFGFVLSWPQIQGNTGTVDVALLLAEWLAIGIVGTVLAILARAPGETPLPLAIINAMNARNDAIIEAARIKADATMRAAGK